jgi:maltose/maltodextrin transport system substrate-binding protein
MHLTRRRLSLAGLACAAAPLARAATPEPLVVWYSVEGAKGIRKLGEAFTAATGVPVVVETPDGIPGKFQQAASAGKGPDI